MGLPNSPFARNVDAEVLLAAYDVRHGRSELLRKSMLIGRPVRGAAPRLDQIVRARQAPGMTGEDVIAAGSHGFFLSAGVDGWPAPRPQPALRAWPKRCLGARVRRGRSR